MEDDSIVNLYWARSENAISETVTVQTPPKIC